MSVRFITGKSGVGKTNKIISEVIESSLLENASGHFLVIVPEQSTLNVQHTFVRKHPRHCLSNIEILSFGRLAYRLSDLLGVAGKTVISEVGKNMLIRKIVMSSPDKFPVLYGHIFKKGYVNELRGLLGEFSRYAVADSDFDTIINNVEETLLKHKLADCQQLYSDFNEAISKTYFSGDSLLDKLIEKADESSLLRESEIFVDGFYGFTPIQFKLIERLALTVKKLTINLTVDNELINQSELSEHHLYRESFETYKRLQSIMSGHPHLEVQYDRVEKSGIDDTRNHLRNWLYQYPYRVFNEKSQGYHLIQAASVDKEVEYIRNSILHMIRDKGYRFCDVSILCGDIGRYRLKLEAALKQASIPYYIDNKRSILMNEVAGFLLSVVDMGRSNMSYNSVFSYLKSGYVALDETITDHTENYVLRYGIRGLKRWKKPFELKVPDFHGDNEEVLMQTLLKEMNEQRELFIGPLEKYLRSGAKTVREHIRALYEFMSDIHLDEKIEEKKIAFDRIHDFNKSREFNQLYSKVITLLEELHEIGGEDVIDYNAFYEILEAGLEQTELGNVPARMDEVLIGDLTRSRISDKKILYMMGVNEGLVPFLQEGVSLFSDRDRDVLSDKGFELAPSAKKNLVRDQFYIYLKVLTLTDMTFISYAMSDDEGKTARPAHLIYMLRKICPTMPVHYGEQLEEERLPLYHPDITYDALIKGLSVTKDTESETLYHWFDDNQDYTDKLSRAVQGKEHDVVSDILSSSMIQSMYKGEMINTVTRLEQYRRCPFAHFARYGLKAEERQNYEITMPQLGLVFHKVIELFSKRIIDREMSWHEITDTIRVAWIEELVDSVLADDSHQVFYDNARNQHRIQRMRQILNKTIKAIGYQITGGDFEPVSSEWQFMGEDEAVEALNLQLDNNTRMKLLGTIDRVDMVEDDGTKYLTIVDYKSGNQQFDIGDIYNGLQLQLMVYLNAAVEVKSAEMSEKVIPAGVFYLKIDDPFIQGDMNDSDLEDVSVMKQFKLRGVVLNNDKVIKMLDKQFVKESHIIPVKRNNDGSLSKQSKVLDDDTLSAVQQYVNQETTRLGNGIVNGTIHPKPVKQGEMTACDHCLYKSVCGFDDQVAGCSYDVLEKLSEDEVIDKMQECIADGKPSKA